MDIAKSIVNDYISEFKNNNWSLTNVDYIYTKYRIIFMKVKLMETISFISRPVQTVQLIKQIC